MLPETTITIRRAVYRIGPAGAAGAAAARRSAVDVEGFPQGGACGDPILRHGAAWRIRDSGPGGGRTTHPVDEQAAGSYGL
jgi:hypothetical protein